MARSYSRIYWTANHHLRQVGFGNAPPGVHSLTTRPSLSTVILVADCEDFVQLVGDEDKRMPIAGHLLEGFETVSSTSLGG